MATIAFAEFLREVMPHVPDCPEPLALNAIRNAAIEFCDATMYWQSTIPPVTVGPLNLPYTLIAPADADVTKVLSVCISGGRPLGPTTLDELDNKVYDWRSKTGDPLAYYQPSPSEITLYPIPDTGDTVDIVIRLVYQPTRDATTVDDSLYHYWLEEIAQGALSKLQSIVGRSWSNPAEATRNGALFADAKVEAAIDAQKSYGRVINQIQMRAF